MTENKDKNKDKEKNKEKDENKEANEIVESKETERGCLNNIRIHPTVCNNITVEGLDFNIDK